MEDVDTILYERNLDTSIQASQANLIRSGNYDFTSGGISNRNSLGHYWQSGARSNTTASHLTFHAIALYPHNANSKANGFTIRCLVR